MWISKKKLEQKLRKAETESWFKQNNEQDEYEQWRRIEKLEKQVKKLKKIVREGY